MPSRRRFIALSSATAGLAGLASVAAPGQSNIINRNARIMVGFPAGSSPDLVARLLPDNMKEYAPSLIVDNRPGAGGRLPLEALKGGDIGLLDGMATTRSIRRFRSDPIPDDLLRSVLEAATWAPSGSNTQR